MSPSAKSVAAFPDQPYDVAVLVRSLLRPGLERAIRSVFAQDFAGSVQILVGPDGVAGAESRLAGLRAECPERMRLDVLDLGYSTGQNRGGLYACAQGGALCLLLAYAAHARHVIFLDDDNWAAPDHLSALRRAVEGFGWAYTLRWFADGETGAVLCPDEWESMGPARGAFAAKAGGFVDLNCLMMDKMDCHFELPWLAGALYPNGNGHDRLLFVRLVAKHPVGWTGRPTLCYAIRENDPMHKFRASWLAERGVTLSSGPITA